MTTAPLKRNESTRSGAPTTRIVLRPLVFSRTTPQGFLNPLQERFLVKEVLVGVGRKAQLRENRKEGLLRRGLLRQADRLLRVEAHIGDADLGDANSGPDEAVAVEIEKVFHFMSSSTAMQQYLCR